MNTYIIIVIITYYKGIDHFNDFLNQVRITTKLYDCLGTQVQSRCAARSAAVGVRSMCAWGLHLSEPGRHRRQAGAADGQPVAAR